MPPPAVHETLRRRAWRARYEAECRREISAALRRRARELEEEHRALASQSRQFVLHSRRAARRALLLR